MKAAAVTFDIGGVIYSDDVFKRAIFIALNKLSAGVNQDDFDQVYNAHLNHNQAPFEVSCVRSF